MYIYSTLGIMYYCTRYLGLYVKGIITMLPVRSHLRDHNNTRSIQKFFRSSSVLQKFRQRSNCLDIYCTGPSQLAGFQCFLDRLVPVVGGGGAATTTLPWCSVRLQKWADSEGCDVT